MAVSVKPPDEPARPSGVPRPDSGSLLAGQVAIVTGGALGIGAGIAATLSYHGARVLIVDRDADAARETADAIARDGVAPSVLAADVTEPSTAAQVVTEADRLGGAAILVNNVGDYRPSGEFLATAEADWERSYQLNLLHVFRLTRAVLPGMVARRDGNILNVSSVEGMRGIPGNAVYGAFKAAIINFTAGLAAEVGQHGIRVNCLAPDFTDTPQTPMWAGTDDRYADHVGRWVPVGRFGHRSDQGDAALFLVSPQSRYVTGTTLRTDGGTLAAAGWFRRGSGRYTNMPRPLK
jgi:2-hydroxycyclohexanecarboxyl-CoA dehydrogenase